MNFKILVADDEYYARKALVMMLEKSELPISVNGDFEDGEEVIEFLQENEADIIITDIRMPNTDGLELAKYVQEHMPKCSVVIETGYEDFQYARNALRYQVKDYLTKPINESELLKSIKNILAEKTQSDNLENMNKLKGVVENLVNRSPSSRQLKKYKFFLPAEIYLLAVFMRLASKFCVFPLVLKFRDSFVSVYCYSNLYNLRSFLREYLYQ